METLSIVHVNDIAGVASTLARAQHKLGHKAVVLRPSTGSLRFNIRLLSHYKANPDVVHIHGGARRSQIAIPLLRRILPRAIIVYHYHGTDARSGANLHWRRSADLEFISTPDLVGPLSRYGTYEPRAEWLPNPVEVPDVAPDFPGHEPVVFSHFPTDARLKGTAEIRALFSGAFPESPPWLVENSGIPHERVLRCMARSHAVIDQLTALKSYGLVSIEAMSLGRPAFSSYEPALFPDDCPVLRLDMEDAIDSLRAIAADDVLRRTYGRRGREYVSRVHAADRIAKSTIARYRWALEHRAEGTRPLWTAAGEYA